MHITYGGSGASARGALLNADAVQTQLRAGLGDKLDRFALLLDSGLDIDLEPLEPQLPTLERRLTAWAELTGAVGAPACVAAHPAELWRCLAAEYALEYVQSDVLARAPLYDSEQLAFGGLTGPPVTPLQAAYAEALRARTALLLARVTAARPGSGAITPACYSADAGQKGSAWRDERVGGVSMEAAVDDWFYAAATKLPHLLVDDCDGFACGPGCVKGW